MHVTQPITGWGTIMGRHGLLDWQIACNIGQLWVSLISLADDCHKTWVSLIGMAGDHGETWVSLIGLAGDNGETWVGLIGLAVACVDNIPMEFNVSLVTVTLSLLLVTCSYAKYDFV